MQGLDIRAFGAYFYRMTVCFICFDSIEEKNVCEFLEVLSGGVDI